MKGDRLPSEHNVGLHCAPKVFLDYDENGQAVGVGPSAFRADEDGISVNWLEYHGGTADEKFRDLCALLKSARDVRKSHRVGMMAIAEIETIQGTNGDLYVEHDPLTGPKPNPAHSLIKGVGPTDDEVLHDLSTLVELREFV